MEAAGHVDLCGSVFRTSRKLAWPMEHVEQS